MTGAMLLPGMLHPFSGQDLPWLLAAQARLRHNHPFMVWAPLGGASRQWTYGQFVDRVRRLASGLWRRGVRPRDAVLIHLDNCPEALLSWYACTWLGAVAVTTNARSVDDDLNYFASHVGAVAAITQPRFAARVAASCPGLRWIAVTADDNGEPPLAPVEPGLLFDAIDDHGRLEPMAQRPPDPLAPCSVQFTSGTTARPKAVLWTHANALWGARVNAAHEDLRASDVHLTFLPLFHTNAQAYSVLASLWVGATVVVQPRFSASRFWPTALEHRCTWVSLIPFCVKALMAQDKPAAHHFRMWGSAVNEPPSDAHFGIKTMGWWGMTETITHGIVGSPHGPNTPLSIGRPAPEYDIAVVDSDARPVRDSRLIEPGGSGPNSGHLWVRQTRGLGLFAEYLGNAKATADAFDPDGWFNTGDLVQVLADGSLQFGDRHKDMLKVGGENVAASEIERVVLAVPGVHECAVVAKKHPMLDEVPVLFIRPNECAQGQALASLPALALDDLQARVTAACAAKLADFKRPHELRLVEDFPRSTLEKIAKAQLRAML